MSNELKPDILFRLYLARQALESGIRDAADAVPVARMRAFMGLDDAVEWTLVSLLSLLNKKPKTEALGESLDLLVAVHPELGAHVQPLQNLRRVRNRVKHDGMVPSHEEGRQAAVRAESFVRDALHAVTGKALEEITPASLIVDEVLEGTCCWRSMPSSRKGTRRRPPKLPERSGSARGASSMTSRRFTERAKATTRLGDCSVKFARSDSGQGGTAVLVLRGPP